MAITQDVTRISPYIKLGSDRNFCVICAMKEYDKLNDEKNIDSYYETQDSLKKKLVGKPMIYLHKRGFEQCICMDCVKEIAKEYTDLVDPQDLLTIADEPIINEPPAEILAAQEEEAVEEPEVVKEEVKKNTSNRGKNKTK